MVNYELSSLRALHLRTPALKVFINPNYQSKIRVWNSYLVCTKKNADKFACLSCEQSCIDSVLLTFSSDRLICGHGYYWSCSCRTWGLAEACLGSALCQISDGVSLPLPHIEENPSTSNSMRPDQQGRQSPCGAKRFAVGALRSRQPSVNWGVWARNVRFLFLRPQVKI